MKGQSKLSQIQQLAMSQQQRQSLQILQMSLDALESFLKTEYCENPLLEYTQNDRSEDEEDYTVTDSVQSYEAAQFDIPEESFADSWQMSVKEQFIDNKRTNREIALLSRLIDLMDDHGFLDYSNTELAKFLKCPEEQITCLRSILTTAEPYGVGFRNCSDFLRHQLYLKKIDITDALDRLISSDIELIATSSPRKIASILGADIDQVRKWISIIRTLNLYPIHSSMPCNTYVRPDLIVERRDGELCVRINGYESERLAVSSMKNVYFADVQSDTDREYIREKYFRARTIINAVDQRERTLLKIGQLLIDRQADYFSGGIMHAITQAAASKLLSVNKSTISRAVAGKYVQCSRGCIPLVNFFSSGCSVETNKRDAADSVSRNSVKESIKAIINKEGSVLSDEKIRVLLSKNGVTISRRTVAKYRKEIGICSAVCRRNIK